MKKKEERLEKQLAETQAENRRLHDPLQKVHSIYNSYNNRPPLLMYTHRLVKRLLNCIDN